MKRKLISIFLIAVLFTGNLLNNIISVADTEVKVYFNNQQLNFDVKPEIVKGRTMVPLRTIFEALDLTVYWYSETSKIVAEKEALKIMLTIGSDIATVNGKNVKIDAPAFIENGRTMVPLRFIAESTGANVKWDPTTLSVFITTNSLDANLSYKIVDTGLAKLFTSTKQVASLVPGDPFYGQDGNYNGFQPSYTDNSDGTVTDNVTGLMWQKTMDAKMTYTEAVSYANKSRLGGYDDWRIPNIKELFSLILFTGESGGEVAKVLYIDTHYFDQPIGDTSIGEREIDAQVWSSTQYVSTTMHGDKTVFGVNFIDGRIKGYAMVIPRTKKDNKGYFRLVRGNERYRENIFVNNGDGTISDLATGLMWQMSDDGDTKDWQEALEYTEKLELAGYSDWRLPNIKELQSIVDYSKSVKTTGTPAINNLFVLSKIIDPVGNTNYGYYWSGTTHQDGNNIADSASYVAFGEAQGKMFGELLDVHGCGAVRSDPKSGKSTDYPQYFGPQGDVRYVYNYVLAVRNISK